MPSEDLTRSSFKRREENPAEPRHAERRSSWSGSSRTRFKDFLGSKILRQAASRALLMRSEPAVTRRRPPGSPASRSTDHHYHRDRASLRLGPIGHLRCATRRRQRRPPRNRRS